MYSQVPPDVPQRVMYWHIESPYKYMIYPIIVVSMAIACYGFYKKFKFWWKGAPDKSRFNNWWERIKILIWDIPFQVGVLNDRVPGIMHVLMFWSMIVLAITTAVIFLDVDFKISLYQGPLYLALTLLSDLAGLALFIGIIIAGVRRYIIKPDRLDNRWDDAYFLILLFLITVTGFLLEGIRIHYTNDPWAKWSPIGYAVSFGVGGMGELMVRRVYQSLWWFHFAILFGFIAAFPYTKIFHIATLPVNVFFSSLIPKGSLPRVDIEAMLNDEKSAENFNVGVSEVKDLTWKQRFDYDSCIRCGRCQDVCPAYLNKHPLSPKKLINDLKDFSWKEFASAKANKGNGAQAEQSNSEQKLIVGSAFPAETIWECRTCRACMEVCPARIDHIPQIMELRRAEVMMRGQLPQDAAISLKTMEKTGNPFGPQEARSTWIKEQQIPVVGPGEECEALFWIGCCTTYDVCKQKIAYNVLKILMSAGVKVAALGDDENCCADPARILGDENIFQMLVKKQLELIKTRKFKYLVAHCAHCYNVFKNEYPQFGADFPVKHHTEVILDLIREGRLKLDVPVDKTITYHDPCYLGRYNGIYDQPREILKAIRGIKLVEMKHTRDKALCCGAGGGHYWMDIPNGERLNVTRVKEAQDTNAQIVAVGCVYCLHMIDDAIKILNLDEKMMVQDVSELVVEAMGGLAETSEQCALEEVEAA